MVPTLVLAGPNAGGVLLVHSANLTYEGINECGQGTAPDSCGAVVSEIDNATSDSLKVWKVYAAFPPGSSPRLKGLTFGVDYDDAYGDSTGVVIRALGPCADFQLAMNGWPGDSTGTSLLWDDAQTSLMTEVYWFAGYNYYGNPATFALIPHPEQGGYFIDDSKPGQMDPIADYGSLGFGQPGYVPSCAIGGGDSDNNAAPNAPSSGPPSGAGPDNAGGQMAVSFLASAVPDTIYIDPGPNDTLQVQLTSEDTACTIQLRTRIQRTGAVVNTQTISLSANTAELSSKIPFSRQNGLALVELILTHGSSSRLLVECPDNDTITFNGAPVELYNGPLTFYVPQGADSLCLHFPPHEAGGQFWLTYPGLGGWIQGNSGGNDTLAVLALPPEAAGCAWTLALDNQDWSWWGAFQTRFHFPGIRDTPAPHRFDSWFRPDFSFSYGWNLDSPPALPPAELYDPQAVAGADNVKYYIPDLRYPTTSPYPYTLSPVWPTTQTLWTGPQWFTFYNWPGHGSPHVCIKSYSHTLGVESWTTDPRQRRSLAMGFADSTVVPWDATASNVLHVRITNGETRFGVQTDAAGAVCGPTLALSWAGEDKTGSRYTPWSYFYVSDDMERSFQLTLQITAMGRDNTYSYRQWMQAELVVKSPTGALDSVLVNDANHDRITARFGDSGPGGVWSFRIRAPQKLDPNHPPEVEVALDDSLPPYAAWLGPDRLFVPVTTPGWRRMGRDAVTEHWNINVPIAPYVCTARLEGAQDIENPPLTSHQTRTDDAPGRTKRFPDADSLGLWGGVSGQTWSARPFAGQADSFYTMQRPSLLDANGLYLDPGTGRPQHLLELTAGSSHCDGWYNQDTCKATIDTTATAAWPVTSAQQRSAGPQHSYRSVTHALSRARKDGMLMSAELVAPDTTTGGLPDYAQIGAEMDTLWTDWADSLRNLWSLEGSDWILGGFDREFMTEAAYQMRSLNAWHAIDLGEGPTDLKMSRELADIADVRGTWSYPVYYQINCAADTTCTPLCDLAEKWDDLESARQPGQGLSLYVEAGFYGARDDTHYVYVMPDTLAEEALASLMLGANAVRAWARYTGNPRGWNQDQISHHSQALWHAMDANSGGQDPGWVPTMLKQVVSWLDGIQPGTGIFGRTGKGSTQCPGGSIVYGTGQGWYSGRYGVWIVVCNLGAEGPPADPDAVGLPSFVLHGWQPADSLFAVPWHSAPAAPTWDFSDGGLICTLYHATWAVAFATYPNSASVKEGETRDLEQLSVAPVPATGTARAHFFLRAGEPYEIMLTDVAGRRVLERRFEGHAGWNDWIWNGYLDRGRASAGVYFLQVNSRQGGSTRRRLVVCR